jgi:hypothetical protein
MGLSRLMPGASSRGARTAGGSGGPMSTIMDSRLVGTPCYMVSQGCALGLGGAEWQRLRVLARRTHRLKDRGG